MGFFDRFKRVAKQAGGIALIAAEFGVPHARTAAEIATAIHRNPVEHNHIAVEALAAVIDNHERRIAELERILGRGGA